ncbi:MAG: response regulator [Nitrospirae bacterium]|nr:response regulator [Nitrospirota bacterium]
MREKILLVEDSKSLQQIYKTKLTYEQFHVLTADNGMEAIKILSQEKPDLILLDLMMPLMDGYKVLQVVKTDPKLAHIPVLVFSAKGQSEEVEKALNLGAAGYVVKATTKPNEVVERIRKILSEQPKVKELTQYIVEINETAYDAKKLASDLNLLDLKCVKCGSQLLLHLTPDFPHGTPWFSGKFFCQICQA